MPKRTTQKQIFGGPQGGDAYVVIKKPTVQEAFEFNKWLNKLPTDGGAGLSNDDKDKNEQEARVMFAKMVLDWNLVDSEDEPLPKPHNNPDAFGALFTDELQWVANCILGDSEAEKKDEPSSSKPSTPT